MDQSLINEIREKTDIVEFIGKYISLTKKGKNYFGLCPFHADTNPSLSVSREKQIYKCFVCGEAGNVFNFLMKYDNLTFLDAVKTIGDLIGIHIEGMGIDFPQVIRHKSEISKRLVNGVGGLLKANRIRILEGQARFVGEKKVEILKTDGSAETPDSDAVIVATGSVNVLPPIPGLKECPACIDSTGALSLDHLPESMIVIGGGVIGLEIACAYAGFGTRVTVVEALTNHSLPLCWKQFRLTTL